jgi:hypothetical protein
MDADPKFEALFGGDLFVAFRHRTLDRVGAAQCIDDARKLCQEAVACSLDDPPLCPAMQASISSRRSSRSAASVASSSAPISRE